MDTTHTTKPNVATLNRAGIVSGGHHSYHDAIIFACESVDDAVNVRVVFSHPTQPSMLPCTFFLSGSCRFDDRTCKFSHGEIVSLSSLKEYEEPDFSGLAEGSQP